MWKNNAPAPKKEAKIKGYIVGDRGIKVNGVVYIPGAEIPAELVTEEITGYLVESVVDATAEEIKVDLTQEGENVVATVLDAQTTQTPEDGEIPNTDEILPSQTLPQGDEAPQTGGIL